MSQELNSENHDISVDDLINEITKIYGNGNSDLLRNILNCLVILAREGDPLIIACKYLKNVNDAKRLTGTYEKAFELIEELTQVRELFDSTYRDIKIIYGNDKNKN